MQRFTKTTPRGRLARVLLISGALVLVGVGYALVCRAIGTGIPCVFRWITGFQCPGCGVSRMCMSLLQGDFAAAWRYNPAILCLLPFGAVIAGNVAVRYVKAGQLTPSRWVNGIVYITIAVLLVFGVGRNIIT